MKLSKKDIMEKYPIGSYYICAASFHASPSSQPTVRQITSHNFLGLQYCGKRYYAQNGQGCLFYYGTWAPLCDSEGNILSEKEKEVNYEIY